MSATASHGATLTVDLRALQDNWHLMSARAQAAEAGAVVKADAYGIGIEAAVPALWRAGCRSFFVAHLSEARRVRAVAPDALIYVLNGFPEGAASAFLADRLTPVLGSRAEAEEWRIAGSAAPCAIHIDTAMNRLGFDMAEALASKTLLDGLNIDLVMTHFSSSEVADDPANAAQIAAFAGIATAFPSQRKSLLNSSGHFLAGAPTHDLTRPGFGLYGGNPTPGQPNPMRPVVRLEAPIIQIRQIAAGTQVGYNHTWTAQRDSRLVTVSCGYADGYPRNASGKDNAPGGEALIGDVICPFVGTVSMDLIIIDTTDAPESACRRGAMATLIGGPLDIDRVGASARTIGYEMLTNLGRRYQRQYIGS
ncbi:MAG: alanine racemase [Bosea sp. (in: a-proteobacteria)]